MQRVANLKYETYLELFHTFFVDDIIPYVLIHSFDAFSERRIFNVNSHENKEKNTK